MIASRKESAAAAADDELDIGEVDMSDGDIVGAMSRISGYLDISTTDFRALYHVAHHNAVDRLVGGIRADKLLRTGITPLTGDLTLDQAARQIVAGGCKGLPVVNAERQVIGILTETDYLRRLKAETFLELMLHLICDDGELVHRCHETRVDDAMTAPPVTVPITAGFREILDAFRRHPGRTMPVVDAHGRALGMLLRKDFLTALDTVSHLEH